MIHALTLEGLAVAGLIHEQAKKIKAQRVNQRTRASINELIELDKAIAKCLEEVNQKERLLFDKLRLIIPLIEGRKRH